MSSDALFQLGIVSVCLNASQTEISTRGPSASPNAPRFRVPARRAALPGHLPIHCRDHADTELPPPSRLHHARQHPSLLCGQRHS